MYVIYQYKFFFIFRVVIVQKSRPWHEKVLNQYFSNHIVLEFQCASIMLKIDIYTLNEMYREKTVLTSQNSQIRIVRPVIA